MDYLDYQTNLQDVAVVLDELSFWSSRFGHLLFDNIEIRPHQNILDIGCATGFPLFELAHTFGPTSNITGVDLWVNALDRAKQKQEIYNLPNVKIVESDARKLPFDNESFDLIVSNLGINNFSNPQQVLAECYRVAKQDASIIITTNLKGHMQQFYDVFREVLKKLKLLANLEKLKANEDHRGTVHSVSSLLENAGFEISKKVESSFALRFLNAQALFGHFLVKCGFLEGWLSVVEKPKQVEVFSLLERKLNEIAKKQGELQMTIPMLFIQAEK